MGYLLKTAMACVTRDMVQTGAIVALRPGPEFNFERAAAAPKPHQLTVHNKSGGHHLGLGRAARMPHDRSPGTAKHWIRALRPNGPV